MNVQKYILELLNSNEESSIKGKLFLQKEIFLIIKEVLDSETAEKLDSELSFEAYNYGPYSFNLENILKSMEKNNLIDVNTDNNDILYTITNKGKNHLNEENIGSNIKNKIFKLKMGSERLGYKGLIRYVYFNYPEYTTKSLIKDEVMGEDNGT